MTAAGLAELWLTRLAALEAKETLEPYHRGELRAMTHCRPDGDQLARIERLLRGDDSEAPPSEAWERGRQRARDSQPRGYS